MANPLYSPKYISINDVKTELRGRVMFSNEEDNYISDPIILDKIAKAESVVEIELSRIYSIPFKGLLDEPFNEIDNEFYSSKQYISSLSLFTTCVYVLDTWYTQSGGNKGEDAKANYVEQIKNLKKGILDKEDISYYWKNPPLPGLKLNTNASWANAALPPPMNAVIGGNDINKQLILKKLTNPNCNWWSNRYPWR